MPETKIQKSVFRILMAFVMVWGMEVYNHFLTEEITARSFRMPISELLLLMGIVILLQQLIAGKIARKIAFHIVNQEKRETFIFTVAMQIVTVLLMCPMMSFVAVLMFKSGVPLPLPVKWMQTFAANLPMAMAWQLLVAGPLVGSIVKKIGW